MKKKDILLISLLAIIAVLLSFKPSGKSADLVKITKSGKLHCVVSLHEEQEISIGDTNIAEIKDGKIFMKSASCPDKLCIHQGATSDSSKKIICLPNRVIIEVIADSDIDTVVK